MQPFKFNKMSEETLSASNGQPSVAEAPDWSLLNDLSNNQDVKIEPLVPQTPEEKVNTDVVTDEQIKPEEKTEPQAPEKKEETPEKKEEVAAEPELQVKPEFEIKAEDLADVPKTYAEGSWQELAKDMGLEIPEDSFDVFKEHFVPKTKLEEASKMTKEVVLADFTPEMAANIQLIELGLPKELVLEPTRGVDASISRIDELVKMSDVDLYRLALENTEGMTPDMIETELDELTTSGKIVHKAQMERIALMNDRKTFLAERDNILRTRDELVAKHTQDKQRIAEQKKEQETTLFLKTLNDKSDFMGVPIPKEFKDGVIQKFRGGLYDSALTDAANKVNLILFNELGPKFAKLIKDSAFAKGKESEIKKQANIPPIQAAASGQKTRDNNQENTEESPFEIIREDFGKK